ncbi:LysR family transcriptional regulator [Microbacteriaceae bacterium K1510]|nr:LysR family transcriptional regulator [Microbacteriaceae bacterium K1510]
MDTLKAMQVFVRVVDAGSLTAAAATCDMSTTMVGNYLHALENKLGMSLLTRTTRRQQLTEFGKIYYDRCVEILGLVGDAEALAVESRAAPRGRLRITASAVFGTERLMPALADYAALYPAVDLDVVLTDAVVDLVEDDFEAAIRIGELRDSSLIARPLGTYKLTMCAAPGYIAEHGAPREPEDLKQHSCLMFTYSSRSEWRSAQSEWRMTGAEGDVTIPIKGRAQVDSAQGLRRAALAGMGIVMLPDVLVSDDIATGQLVRVLPRYESPTRPLNLIYVRDRRMSPKLKSFVDFVLQRFAHKI